MAAADPKPPLTVTAISAMVRGVLTDALPPKVRVVGEVSNLSQRDHWFFSLKDEQSALSCVCFKSNAQRLKFQMANGVEVIATGRIDYYPGQGRLQLYVDKIEPVGAGALELRYRALCDQLRQLGYFETDRKKPLPAVPRRVAVVTSRSAAALQDVINTARKRWPGCELYLCDVRVQGAGAAPEIVAAIDALSRDGRELGIDAVILTRGGGSIEDLWAFNERAVADAIYKCALPVVAAIGHESDTTIAELVADLRSATPTQAAMALIPDREALFRQVDHLNHRLKTRVTQRADEAAGRLETVTRHRLFRRPHALLLEREERLRNLSRRLHESVQRRLADERNHLHQRTSRLGLLEPRARLANARQRLFRLTKELTTATTRRADHRRERLSLLASRLPTLIDSKIATCRQQIEAATRHLQSVGPMNVLERGFSYTLGPDGRVLLDPGSVTTGDTIHTMLAKGAVHSVVTVHQDQASTPKPNRQPRQARSKPSIPGTPPAPGLFDD